MMTNEQLRNHSPMTRRLKWFSMLGIAMAVTACTSSTSSTGTQQTGMGFTGAGLCALVTQADVGAALGTTVGAGVPSGDNTPSCSWQDNNGAGATIAANEPSAIGQIPIGMQGANANATAVSGLGDAAFFVSPGGNFTPPAAELNIKKGGRAITITVGNAGNAAFTEAQQEAAEQAIGTVAAKNM